MMSNLLTTASPSPNDADIISAVSCIDTALAIVELSSLRVCLVSKGFQVIVPSIANNVSVQDTLTHEPELRAAFESVIATGNSSSNKEIVLNGVQRRVDFAYCGSKLIVVTVQPIESLSANLHEYMQARDSLFSTSRTISVSEMATTLAHELNTPIGTITNILHGVKLRLQKPDTAIDTLDTALDRALEQAQFTQNIINRIRDFTQSRRPQHEVLDVRDQLREAVSLLDWMLVHNTSRVQFELPELPIFVAGDPTMLQQVLINLVRNAVDAMEHQTAADRLITITASQNEKTATISIADTGQGLGDNADTLFVPFATNKAGGMGVGLTICRSFIELHQGRLWLSPNDGDGCTSYVELPLAND